MEIEPNHITFTVNDVERSIDFYTRILGPSSKIPDFEREILIIDQLIWK